MGLRQVLASQDEKTMKQMHKKTTLKNLARRVAMHSRVLAELKSFKGLTAVELADVMGVPRRSKPDSSRHNLINNPFYQLMA